MPESTFIVVRWPWRFYPSLFVEWALRQLVDWCLCVLEDEDYRYWLESNQANAAWYGGWLALAEARLDELIAMKAMKRLKRSWVSKRPLSHIPAPGVRTFQDAACRLNRLIHRYHARERLIARRVRLLQQEFEQHALQFEVTHHPIDLQPASAGGDGAGGGGVFETGFAGAGGAGGVECAGAGVRLQPDARIRPPP